MNLVNILLPKGRYKLEVIKDGKILEQREDDCRSWNRNAYNWACSMMTFIRTYSSSFGQGFLSLRRTDGTVWNGRVAQIADNGGYSSAGFHSEYGYYGGLGTIAQGIVVGTSTTAESFEGFALDNRIAHGNGTGQLLYNASPAPTASWNNTAKQWTVTWKRDFNNNSSGSVYVGEIAIYTAFYDSSTRYFMPCRDVINPTIEVPATALFTVTYNFITQFPE